MSAIPLLGVPVAQANFGDEIDEIGLIILLVVDLVDGEVLKQGQGNSLIKTLDAAIKHLEKDRERGACQKLNDFIDQVNAFVEGGILDSGDGQDLTGPAIIIRDLEIMC